MNLLRANRADHGTQYRSIGSIEIDEETISDLALGQQFLVSLGIHPIFGDDIVLVEVQVGQVL